MTEWSTVYHPSWFTLLTPLDVIDTGGGSSDGVLPGKVLSTDVGSVGQFFEITVTQESGAAGPTNCSSIGIGNLSTDLYGTGFDGVSGFGWYSDGWFIGSAGAVNVGVGWGTGDVVGVEWHGLTDFRFYKNGTLAYTYTGAVPDGDLYAAVYLRMNPNRVVANFGATSWAHDPGGVTGWSGGASGPAAAVVAQTLPALVQIASATSGAPYIAPTFGTGGFFPDTIAEYLAGRVVRCDFLVLSDFASEPMRVWQGWGTVHTLDGNDWGGVGKLGKIGDIESAIGGTSPRTKFSLSGVDPDLIADALDADEEIYGQAVDVFIQFFDENWQCLDNPYSVYSGIMDTVEIIQTGTDECVVEVSAETIFARRSLAPLGNLTDREQQMLFPGDKGLTAIPSLMSKVAIWPVILPGYP